MALTEQNQRESQEFYLVHLLMTYCVSGLGLGTEDSNKQDRHSPLCPGGGVEGEARVSLPANGPAPLSQPPPSFPLELSGKFQAGAPGLPGQTT